MNFTGKANPLSQPGLDTACQLLGTGAAEIWTLLTVETKGCGYLPDRRPVILFERHIFHKQTGGRYGSPEPGGYLGGAKEYDRLEEAMALDAHAALNSASWGIGQVMGFNSKLAGFPSVESMVEAMIADEDAQLIAVARYLRAEKLDRFLAAHQWEAFAMGYNGPNYKENNYDTKLAAAYAAFSVGPLPQIQVRQAQLFLTFLGFHTGGIDGIPGKLTLNAIAQFRDQERVQTSGAIGAQLSAALQSRSLIDVQRSPKSPSTPCLDLLPCKAPRNS